MPNHSDMKPQPEDSDIIVASLLFLLTRYTIEQDARVGKAIIEHLALLETHPKTFQPNLVSTCKRLQRHWDGILSVGRTQKHNNMVSSTIDTKIH
jgi:hypothetical protein